MVYSLLVAATAFYSALASVVDAQPPIINMGNSKPKTSVVGKGVGVQVDARSNLKNHSKFNDGNKPVLPKEPNGQPPLGPKNPDVTPKAVPQEYIVRVQTSTDAVSLDDKIRGLAGKYGLSAESRSQRRFRLANLNVVQVKLDKEEALLELLDDPTVISAQPNLEHSIEAVPWGWDRATQRGPITDNLIDIPSQFGSGAGVDVYMVDSGIFPHTSFITPGTNTSRVAHSYFYPDPLWGETLRSATDGMGHGTHVAGIVGSNTHGIARQATLHSVRVLNSAGRGSTASFLSGMQHVITNRNPSRRSIINMSTSGPTDLAIMEAIRAASNAGIPVIGAAGNNAYDACSYTPGNSVGALTVGALKRNDTFAAYSNYGSCVDILAPGTSIESTWLDNDYRNRSGTSMATPHVTGALAVIWGAYPFWTQQQALNQLMYVATVGNIPLLPQGTTNRVLFIGPGSLQSSCASSPCKNGGLCSWYGGGIYRCTCPWNFTGTLCEIPK